MRPEPAQESFKRTGQHPGDATNGGLGQARPQVGIHTQEDREGEIMGPVFQRVTTVAAAATSQPLQTAPAWQHRFLKLDSVIEYVLDSTTVADTYNVTLGSDTAVQESNVPGGGTVGLFIAFVENVKQIVGLEGDELAFTITFAGAASAMLEVHLTPAM